MHFATVVPRVRYNNLLCGLLTTTHALDALL